jgi:hypothetical protein
MFGSADLLRKVSERLSMNDLAALAGTSSGVRSSLPAPLRSVLPVLGALREPWMDLVWVAVLGGRVELLRWLLWQSGAAAERRVQRQGITPLMYAREAGQAESVRLLEE